MITAALLFLFLGLIVFGPRKTIELAQTVGRFAAQAKHAVRQLQTDLHEDARCAKTREDKSAGITP